MKPNHSYATGGAIATLLKLIVLIGVLVAGVALWHWNAFANAPLHPAQDHFEIDSGDSFRNVLVKLRRAGINEGMDIEWQALAMQMRVQSRLQAGEYALAPATTPTQLLRQFADGRVLQYRFTLVEGSNMREVRAALDNAPQMKHQLADLDDAALMAALGRNGVHPEGRFLPDTYNYTRNSSDVALLKRAAKAMDTALDKAWKSRETNLPLKDAEQALILASIVEKETGRADERARIAGVFVRRLKIGMLLQTDPTVIYGMGSSYDGNIRKRDLLTDTPYNTYTRPGLPPTPIAMPGRDALRAATHPQPGDALYFVARGDGSHEFTSNLVDHVRAVAKYQLHRNRPTPDATPPQ